MNEFAILDLLSNNVELALTLALPIAMTALLIGLVSQLLQTATSVHEPNLTLIPKLLGVAAVTAAMGPYIVSQLVQNAVNIYSDFTRFIH